MARNTKITKNERLNIIRGARRNAEIEVGVGLNRKNSITLDKKKHNSKYKCRNKNFD